MAEMHVELVARVVSSIPGSHLGLPPELELRKVDAGVLGECWAIVRLPVLPNREPPLGPCDLPGCVFCNGAPEARLALLPSWAALQAWAAGWRASEQRLHEPTDE